MAAAAPIDSAPAASVPEVPERIFGPAGGRAYRHFLEWSVGYGFAMAILKVSAPRDRAELLAWTKRTVPGVGVAALNEPGRRVTADLLEEACPSLADVSVLVLTGLEEAPERLWRCAHLNVQRNQLAKRFPVPWVVLVHPSAAFDLAMHAPDFIDFAGLRMREENTEPIPSEVPRAERLSGREEGVVHEAAAAPSDTGLLQEAFNAITLSRYDEAADLLASYDLDHPGARANDARRIRLEGLLLERREPGKALERLDRALELAADPRLQAHILGNIARIRWQKGDVDAALAHHQEALKVYECLGDRHSRAVALGDIAHIRRDKGEVDAAIALYQEALAEYEALGDRHAGAVTLGDIARIRTYKGEVDAALAIHEKRLKVFEEIGDRRSRAVTLGDIARIRATKGEVDAALVLHEEELKAYEELGDRRMRGVTLDDIARIRATKGDMDAALMLHDEVLGICEDLGDKRGRAVTLGHIARIRRNNGDVDTALALHTEALRVYEELGDRNGSAHARFSMGQIAVAKGNNKAAYDHFLTSYSILRELGRLDGICTVGMDLGQLLLATGREAEAREILERSRDGFLRLGQPSYAQQAQRLLDGGAPRA